MRELKFRVWGLYGDEYTYIDEENQAEAESFWDKGCIAILDEKHIVKCGTDEDGDGEGYEYCDVEEVETIEQYTGLKDKNGKEIYEGDIVTFMVERFNNVTLGFESEDWHTAVVEWNQDDACYSFMEGDAPFSVRYEAEVVGNIHENQELLSKEEKCEN